MVSSFARRNKRNGIRIEARANDLTATKVLYSIKKFNMKNIRIFLAIQLFWILAFIVGIVLRKTSLFYIAFSIGFVANLISVISVYWRA